MVDGRGIAVNSFATMCQSNKVSENKLSENKVSENKLSENKGPPLKVKS